MTRFDIFGVPRSVVLNCEQRPANDKMIVQLLNMNPSERRQIVLHAVWVWSAFWLEFRPTLTVVRGNGCDRKLLWFHHRLLPSDVAEFKQKERNIMQVANEKPGQAALPIDKSASALGLDEFSLLSRIQTGEINAVRARSGEMMILETELERLAGGHATAQPREGGATLPDECLGIERRYGGLKPDGQIVLPYKVGECRFSEDEINGYRAASSAIATQLNYAKGLNRQLSSDGQLPESCDFEIKMTETERWEVRSALLNLNHGEILLCQRGDEFAVIERFHEDSPYAQAKGDAQMLWKGNDAQALTEAFRVDARLTLKFMASNLTAKAQKIVWEQFPDHRPGHVVAAITEQCHLAIAHEETISQNQRMGHRMSGGISI